MVNTVMRLQLGDKVQITQNVYDNVAIDGLAATKGSLGRVVSYEELCREWPSKEGWLSVKRAYPIRFEHVVPLSQAVDGHEPVYLLGRKGDIELLPTSFLVVVSS
ncbi:MAG: hypothetical protein RBT80_22590 [Candidatus Vecturithrix sp.]|jgi:hypothetical protein|nr:hypothetical protein [Candidatus Vecturithrix sp.]